MDAIIKPLRELNDEIQKLPIPAEQKARLLDLAKKAATTALERGKHTGRYLGKLELLTA